MQGRSFVGDRRACQQGSYRIRITVAVLSEKTVELLPALTGNDVTLAQLIANSVGSDLV